MSIIISREPLVPNADDIIPAPCLFYLRSFQPSRPFQPPRPGSSPTPNDLDRDRDVSLQKIKDKAS